MPAQIPPEHLTGIRTLVQILETGSLSQAARRLALTPSAVSKQVRRLEESLGVRLLERTTRRVRATEAGLELFQRSKPLFESFSEAITAIREHRSDVSGRVRLSASPALGRTRVLPVLASLAREHPDLDFDVVLTGRRLDFFEEEIDLAVREGALEDSTLVARRLGSASIFLCAAPAYARKARLRTLADLRDHDLLLVPAAEAQLGAKLGDSMSSARTRFRVNDLFAVRQLAELGAGVAVLPDYVAADALSSRSLVRVLPNVPLAEMPIHAVLPSRRHLPRRIEVVLDALGSVFAAGPEGRR